MYCKNCGTQLPENARFCPNCGTDSFAANGQKTGYQRNYQQMNMNQPQYSGEGFYNVGVRPLNPGEVRTYYATKFHRKFIIFALCIGLCADLFWVFTLFRLMSAYKPNKGDITEAVFWIVLLFVLIVAVVINLMVYNKIVLNISDQGISGRGGKCLYLCSVHFDASYSDIDSVKQKFSGVVSRNNRIVITIKGKKYDLTIENGEEAKKLIEMGMARTRQIYY